MLPNKETLAVISNMRGAILFKVMPMTQSILLNIGTTRISERRLRILCCPLLCHNARTLTPLPLVYFLPSLFLFFFFFPLLPFNERTRPFNWLPAACLHVAPPTLVPLSRPPSPEMKWQTTRLDGDRVGVRGRTGFDVQIVRALPAMVMWCAALLAAWVCSWSAKEHGPKMDIPEHIG